MAGMLAGGTWTANQFLYKPSLGASGAQEKATYDTGVDRVDARLGKEIWVGDPAYGSTLAAALTAIGSSQAILRVPAGTITISSDLTVPANVTLSLERGAVLSVADGKILTINGEIRAGAYQIFARIGAGLIRLNNLLPEVLAEWFIPAGASDHTAYIKLAVDSTNHLGLARPPVVLTRDTYNIANLNFDMAASGSPNYAGLALVGKRSGGTGDGVTLNVGNAADNGILITGKYDGSGTFAVNVTLENLLIKKTAYPGDANGDYGLKLRQVSRFKVKNVKVYQFGGAGLFIQDCYVGSFEGFEAWVCYQGVNSTTSAISPYWGCTTMNFVNPVFMGCKTLIYTSGGRAHATFDGLISDDYIFTSTYYLDIDGQTNQLYFDRCWFEGLSTTGYAINIRTGASSPAYNPISITGSQLHAYDADHLVQTAGTGTGYITLRKVWAYYASGSVDRYYQDKLIIPNATDTAAAAEVLALHNGALTGPVLFMSSPNASGDMVAFGPNGVAVGHNGVANFNGTFNHRFYDYTIPNSGFGYDYKNDAFVSDLAGLHTPALHLRQYYLYDKRIAVGSAAPASQTCNTSTATPYKLTSVTNASSFCRGDTVVITGAGSGGSDLTTQIVQMEWDLSAVYVKNPVQATLTGAAIRISANQGDVRFNTSPDAGKVSHWICTAAGSPGTWVAGGQAGHRTSSGAPSGVTPYFIGEELLDTTNGKWYKSKGLTTSDWVALN
jgi:hypothetical protein